jgi:hypothetical protein
MMLAADVVSTTQMPKIELEVYAAALGLVDDVPRGLGNFDEGYRAVNGIEFPVVDDPRPED